MPDRAASTIGRTYGWKPDLPDENRRYYSVPTERLVGLPPTSDLRPVLGPVWNQGSLGSCSAQAIAGAIVSERKSQKLPFLTPSRLKIYYLEREMDGTIESDAGASLSDGLAVVAKFGYCDESLWPYDIRRFRDRPPEAAFQAAKEHRIQDYAAVRQLPEQLKGCLCQGDPVIFGFTVFESFESDAVKRTGVMPIPTRREKTLGGHAVLLVGHDDTKDAYLCRNSWGESWGLGGCFWMPYAYAHSKYAADFWVIRSVPGGSGVDPAPEPGPEPVPLPSGKKRRIILDVDVQGDTLRGAELVYVG